MIGTCHDTTMVQHPGVPATRPLISSPHETFQACLLRRWPISSAAATVWGMLVTRSRLAHDLEMLGLRSGGAVMVHCRMSALGHVLGGAESVVRGLLDALGPEGTLIAYTGWQDAPPDDLDALDEGTRRSYLQEHPAYDPRVALSRRDHGRVPEAARTWPGALHSGHPETRRTWDESHR